MDRVFQERLDGMEVELFDTGVLQKEETTNEPALSTFVPSKPRNTSGSGPSRELQAAELQRARAKNGRTGPIGRKASKKNNSSTAKIRTCQSDYRDNRYIEIENETGNEIKNQMKTIRKDETIFAAYDKVANIKAKILIVANSDFAHTSKSLFWPDVIMLAAVDVDLTQSVSMASGYADRIFWHKQPSIQ